MTTSLPNSTSRFARSIAALDVPAHVGDLFGPLVDEQHHEVHLGVVALD
jgi:hypothetical protein